MKDFSMASRMRPLPLVPDSTILEAAELDQGYARRLEIWNYSSDQTSEPQLDYVTLSAVADTSETPQCMVTTRLYRKPDELDLRQGSDRLVPAARLSILTIPMQALNALVPGEQSSIDKVDVLMSKLSQGEGPWVEATVSIDSTSANARVLRWNAGALWVGEYRDVTYSAIGNDEHSTHLALRSMNATDIMRLTQ